jgi:hypothetical protein
LNEEMQICDFNYIRTPHHVSPMCAEDGEGKKVYVCYINLFSNSSARQRTDFRTLSSDFAYLGFKLSERPKRKEADPPGSSASTSKPVKTKPLKTFKTDNDKDFPPLNPLAPLKPLISPKPEKLDQAQGPSGQKVAPKSFSSESKFCKWTTSGVSPSMSNPITLDPNLWTEIENVLISKGLNGVSSLNKGSKLMVQPTKVVVISNDRNNIIGTGMTSASQTCVILEELPMSFIVSKDQ